MPLHAIDLALTRNSYYAATALRDCSHARCKATRAATWPWWAAGWRA
jgi:hypothetical protein